MATLATNTMATMVDFVTDYAPLFAIPIGVCAVGLVLTVVINALRSK